MRGRCLIPRAALVVLGAVSFPRPAIAVERVAVELRERFVEASITPWSHARAEDGALLFATDLGLYRYDGARYVRLADDELTSLETVVPYSGGVAVSGHGRRIAWLVDGRVEWLEPPGDDELRAIDADGTALWALVGEQVLRYDGAWQSIEVTGRVDRLDTDARGTMAVGPRQVWALSSTGAELLADGLDAVIHAARTDDALWVQESVGPTWRITKDGRTMALPDLGARNNGLVVRDGVVWATTTDHVVRLDADGPVISKTPAGSPLFDREGSLWLTTFSGPVQLPAPDTVIYTEDDGLPTSSIREAVIVGETLWANTWSTLARFDPKRRVFVAFDPEHPLLRAGRVCGDDDGHTWSHARIGTEEHVIVQLETSVKFPSQPGWECVSAGGWAWMLQEGQIVAARGNLQRSHALPATDHTIVRAGSGKLWLGHGNGRICWAPADPTRPLEWVCEQATEDHEVTALWVAPSGNVWAGTRRGGIWRRTEAGWDPLSPSLGIPQVLAMTSSPRGGVWISGSMRMVRVEEEGAGWVARETVRAWHGIPKGTAGPVRETEGGDLWIGSARGLIHVPRRVRDGPVAAPLPAWTVAGAGPPTEPIEREALDNHLTLELVAHALRDPTDVRYRYRLGPDRPWSEPQEEPRLVLAGMAPGDYAITLQARVVGDDWVSAEAPVFLTIEPPWYATWWFRLAFIGIVAGLGTSIHRIRVAGAVRLHAQRARIAADLHDEVGSALSAIRLTASAAAARPIPIDRAHPMFERIAETSADLGVRLRDIVWCLRPESSHLSALARFLEQRARQLLPGVELEIDVQCPNVVALSLPVLRNVQLVGLEALHNVSKHAKARRVRLGLVPDGVRWRLEVEDDGTGEVAASGGLGLTSMSSRAAAIGATLVLDGVPGRGTRISLTFEPRHS